MIKIGELSNITGVSVKTIRYYEEEGLIVPVEVDRWTNYRYYDDSSINRISEIVYLKDLGFSLKEIKDFNDEIIKEKIKSLQNDMKKFTKNINTLINIKNNKGEFIMKNFVNDEKVIGKWKKLGIVNSIEEFKNNQIEESDLFIFNELYFLPKGEQYWTLSWTKGILFVNDRPMPYQIINGKMLVNITDLFTNEINAYAVYEQVDTNEYKTEDIQIKDNINIPFIKDENLIGFWETVDFIEVGTDFNPDKQMTNKEELYLIKYAIEPNGNLIATYNNGNSVTQKWSRGIVIDENRETASAYEMKTINNQDYLIVEWKSGDYSFGGFVAGSYVLKRIK